MKCVLPWYNCTGWLGVKHQFTYLHLISQVYGEGTQTRSFQYVTDLVDGLVKLMASNYSFPINLGNPDEHTIMDFAHIIRHLVSKCSVGQLPMSIPSRVLIDTDTPVHHHSEGFLTWAHNLLCVNTISGKVYQCRHTIAGVQFVDISTLSEG